MPPPELGEGEGEAGEGEGEGEGEAGEGEGEGEGEGDIDRPEGNFVVVNVLGAPPGGGADVCAVTPGTGGTIVFGTILTPGTVFEGGSVIFDDDGVITCVGDCIANAIGFTRIACGDAVISPGLINAHDHAGWMNDQPWYLTAANSGVRDTERWEQRHDWRTGKRGHDEIDAAGGANADAKAFGEFRFALSGATATLASGGFSSSGGVIRNLDDGGDMGDIGLSSVRYVTFPLGDTNGTQRASGCEYPNIADKPAGPNAPHISEGIDVEARNEFQCLSGTGGGGKDTIDDNSAIIHGIGLSPADVAIMAERGASLIWSPRSNISLYGETAPVTVMKRLGVNIALGTDWLPSGSMNILRELRCALDLNDHNYGVAFTREELWRMVTLNAARATHTDAAIGSLAVGHQADIAVFARHGGPFTSVVESSTEDVALVLKSGRALNGNASVVAALESGCDVVDVCGVSKQICSTREAGKSFTALQAAQNGLNYALASCADETPIEEPTCVPARTETIDAIDGSTLYSGVPSDGDDDGDGIANASDNCPTVFNPARPVDGGAQGNADGDADGDACDVCPLDADLTVCSVFNPDDRDGDGVDAPGDNCPDDANADQLDTDLDLKGDVCDPCPATANPGNEGCPVSVVDIKSDPAITGEQRRVHIEDVVVTAVGSNGFWMQIDPAVADYPGVNNSCIFGFAGAATKPAVGDKLEVDGTASLFFLQPQITSLTFTVVDAGVDIPPFVIEDADIAGISADGAASLLEGCLVEARNAVVEDPAPAAGPGDAGNPRNEFQIQGNVRVDDFLFAIQPQPQLGERFAFLRGPLAFRNSFLKLLPRDANDVAFGDVEIDGYVVPNVFARVGAVQPATFAPLEVRLTRAAAVVTTVLLSSSDPAVLTVPASVDIAAGAITAAVPLTGVIDGTATVSARLELTDPAVDASVRVVADDATATPLTIDPADATLVINRTQLFTVTFDVPTPTAGVSLDVDVTGAIGTVVEPVAVAGNLQSASFTLTTAAAAATGTVAASIAGGSAVTANVNLIELAPLGLVINEIDYDQASTDSGEFVELFNGTGAPVDVGTFNLVFVNGSNKAIYKTITLAGVIPNGGYLLVGAAAVIDAAPAAVIKIAENDQNLIQNGNDAGSPIPGEGVLLFRDDGDEDVLIDGIAYEGALLGLVQGSLTIDLDGDRSTTAADQNDADGSVCRNPATGAWGFCPVQSPGAANAQ